MCCNLLMNSLDDPGSLINMCRHYSVCVTIAVTIDLGFEGNAQTLPHLL